MAAPAALPSRPAGSLSPEQVEAFHRDGFLVLKGFLNSDQVSALGEAYERVVEGFDPDAHSSVFETGKGERDRHFLESGDKVTFFLEPTAPRDGEGKLVRGLKDSINKVGHALHYSDDEGGVKEFREVVMSEATAGVCSSLGFDHVQVPQAMLIAKPKEIGTVVHPHVDYAFIYDKSKATPSALLGLWIPLQQTTEENGCLWGVPGSHRRPVERFFRRTADGSSTEFSPKEEKDFDLTGAVPLPMEAGDCLLIHGAVVHFSKENRSKGDRLAFTWHLVESGKGVEWSPEAWLQRQDGRPFPALY